MELTINVDDELTPRARAVLQTLLGDESAAPAKPAPAKKAAAAKSTPEPDPVVEDDDVVAGPTKEDAVAKAMELVGEGKAAEVKAALAVVGAKRVSELKNDADVAKFFAALDV